MKNKKLTFLFRIFILLMFSASITFGKNVPNNDEDECEGNPECCEFGDGGDGGGESSGGDDDGCGACNQSFSIELFIGSEPHEFDLGGGMLTVKKHRPSPSIFTPQSLIFRDYLETYIRETKSDLRQVTIIRFNGKNITYKFESGSSMGVPIGAQV